MAAFTRDILFQILGMCMYYHFMAKESLDLNQCIFLLLLFLIYIAVICYQQWQKSTSSNESEK